MWWRNKIGGRAIAAALMALTLSGCGFHLRGAGDLVPWPTALNPVRISGVRGTEDVRDELARRLQTQYSVEIVDSKDVPVLRLVSERFERRTLALTVFGKASEYLLRLRVEMQVENASGQVLVPKMVVLLQRDFSYDSTQLLAMDDEQQRLQQDMVRDAARQLLARVSAQYPKKAP